MFEAWKARLLNPLNATTSAEQDVAHANDMASRLAALSDAELSHLWRGEIKNRLAFRGVDHTARLTQLGMPVCILHGDRDEVVPPALGAAIAERIPGAELHLIPGADHGVLLAREAGEVLREWLVRVSRS